MYVRGASDSTFIMSFLLAPPPKMESPRLPSPILESEELEELRELEEPEACALPINTDSTHKHSRLLEQTSKYIVGRPVATSSTARRQNHHRSKLTQKNGTFHQNNNKKTLTQHYAAQWGGSNQTQRGGSMTDLDD
jgi:hypothetical protein